MSELETSLSAVGDDVEFVKQARRLQECLSRLEAHEQVGGAEAAGPEAQLDRELYKLFQLNTLFWMRLKLQDVDPATHPVRQHLAHVRQLMEKKKEIIDKRSRPTLNKHAAARFIRNGLWEPKTHDKNPPNKKIKFSQD